MPESSDSNARPVSDVLEPSADPASEAPIGGEGRGRAVVDDARRAVVVLPGSVTASEEAIVASILALGDEEAIITALWNHCYERLVRQALRRQHPVHVAEDIVQDVFALLTREYGRVVGPQIVGWLHKMVDYECTRQVSTASRARSNRQKVERQLEPPGHAQPAPPQDEWLDLRRDLSEAHRVLVELGPLEEFIVVAAAEGMETETTIALIERRYGITLTRDALYERRRRIRRRLSNLMMARRGDVGEGGSHG